MHLPRFTLFQLDTQSDTVAARFQAVDLPFLKALLMSFTNDESRIVVAGDLGVDVWDVSTSMQVSRVIRSWQVFVHDIAVAPDDTVIVCSDSWVRRYDFAGQILATLANKGRSLCCVSADGKKLAVYGDEDDELTIYDLESNKPLHHFWFIGLTSLALSSDGDLLAVGDYDGRVTLVETSTGIRRWHAEAPGHYRWPWTVPAILLVLWTCLASRIAKVGWRR